MVLMSIYRQLLPIAIDQHGLVTPMDAKSVGATERTLAILARTGLVERVHRGIYRVPAVAGDPLEQHQEALLWAGDESYLSHATALALHGLSDIAPTSIDVSVPSQVRIRKQPPSWMTVHRRAVPPDELTAHEGLRIVRPAQAILDGITSHIGQRFIEEARATAAQRALLTEREAVDIELAVLQQRIDALTASGDR